MFVYRQSNHIQSDIKRNWSSWNFGQEGFKGTKRELDAKIDGITDDSPFWISGFDLYPQNISESKFGELYENYWVLIDTRDYGLSCIELDSEDLESAKTEAKAIGALGDGERFDASRAKLIWSEGEHNIFEV